MKKSKLTIRLILFIIFILLKQCSAQDIAEEIRDDPLLKGVVEGKEKFVNFSEVENKSDYLKKEWGALLSNHPTVGPILNALNKTSIVFNPIFEYTIGLKPSFTWLFFLTLILWITFVIYTFRIFNVFSVFSPTVQYIVSFGIVIIMSIGGTTRILAQSIINQISLFNKWWVQLIGAVIIIFIILLAAIISKKLEKVFKEIKERKKKAETELKRKELKYAVETAKELTKPSL